MNEQYKIIIHPSLLYHNHKKMNALTELMDICWHIGKSFDDIDYWWVGWEEEDQCIFNSDSIEIMKKFLEDNYSSYNNWWGGQELFWEIVFKDKTWLERWEYDWSEWWEYKRCPDRKLSKDEARIKEIDWQVEALLKERNELYAKNEN